MAVKYIKKAAKTPETDDHKTQAAVQDILNDIANRKEEKSSSIVSIKLTESLINDLLFKLSFTEVSSSKIDLYSEIASKIEFAILVAVNLQTAWLSPPVALSAYFLKGVVPEWDLKDIYYGMMQFMVLQIIGLVLIVVFPQIALWLPTLLYGS